MNLQEYDERIQRLQQERDELEKLLADPEERARRQDRRMMLLGRYFFRVRRTIAPVPDVDELRRSLAEPDEWLFHPECLVADGWHQQKRTLRGTGKPVACWVHPPVT